jgi:hypothetical protein
MTDTMSGNLTTLNLIWLACHIGAKYIATVKTTTVLRQTVFTAIHLLALSKDPRPGQNFSIGEAEGLRVI